MMNKTAIPPIRLRRYSGYGSSYIVDGGHTAAPSFYVQSHQLPLLLLPPPMMTTTTMMMTVLPMLPVEAVVQ
jgi:hypothetical protein